MSGGRIIAVVLLLLVLFAVGGGAAWYFLLGPGAAPAETPTPETTPTPAFQIVVSSQDIPRGMRIIAGDGAVVMADWPEPYLRPEYYTSLEGVEGQFARVDIPNGVPVMPSMIFNKGDKDGGISYDGSRAALFAEPDRVAYALPMDTQGAVAWALKPGDRVDVIAAFQTIPVDQEFQTQLPNMFVALPRTEEETFFNGMYGRFEDLPNGQPGLVYPTGTLYPTLIVQLTVQDAVVWHVGNWVDEEEEEAVEPTPEATAAVSLGGAQPTPTVAAGPVEGEQRDIEPITLLVKREDALVLKYLYEMGSDMDLVLRPAGFTDTVIQTQPVWLRYVMDRYQLPAQISDMPVASLASEPLELIPIATPTPPLE